MSFSIVFCRRDKIYPIPTTLSFSVHFRRCGSFNITAKTLKNKYTTVNDLMETRLYENSAETSKNKV